MKVCLRALKESDIWTLHQWINDKEVIRFTNFYRPISEMEQKKWFYDIAYFKNNYVFGIEQMNENKLIGSCGLYNLDIVTHKAEMRIKIGDKTYWGKGFGSEATMLLLDFGFNDLNLNKIWLRVLANNIAAVNLYKKARFKTEGTLRKDLYIKGNLEDVLIMSILREEYYSSIEK